MNAPKKKNEALGRRQIMVQTAKAIAFSQSMLLTKFTKYISGKCDTENLAIERFDSQ